MRTFWEDLGKRFGETAETVSSIAGDVVEIQKLKSQIRTLERGNENDLIDLGKAVYEQFKEGTSVGEFAEALCAAIQDREESIAEYLQKISEVKGDFQCECCGKTVAKDMAYCPYCGTKAPERETACEEAEEAAEEEACAEEVKEETAEEACTEEAAPTCEAAEEPTPAAEEEKTEETAE